MRTVVVTEEELRAIIREEIKALASVKPEDKWLDLDGAAAFFGVTKESIRNWIKLDGLPHHRVGRSPRFDRDELEQWMRTRDRVLRRVK